MPKLVIIGFDGSPDACGAVDFAAARVDAQSAIVVNVWHGPAIVAEAAVPLGTIAPIPPLEDDESLERAGFERAATGAARAREAGLTSVAEVRRASGAAGVAGALLDVADEHEADFLVVGRRGMGRLQSALLGSVADETVQQGRRPVLVVPGQDG